MAGWELEFHVNDPTPVDLGSGETQSAHSGNSSAKTCLWDCTRCNWATIIQCGWKERILVQWVWAWTEKGETEMVERIFESRIMGAWALSQDSVWPSLWTAQGSTQLKQRSEVGVQSRQTGKKVGLSGDERILQPLLDLIRRLTSPEAF